MGILILPGYSQVRNDSFFLKHQVMKLWKIVKFVILQKNLNVGFIVAKVQH